MGINQSFIHRDYHTTNSTTPHSPGIEVSGQADTQGHDIVVGREVE